MTIVSPLTDEHDWRILLSHILRQAIEDYVKLQHPTWRKKKYLHEAWLDAVEMLFNPDYRFSQIQNDDNKDMSLNDFLQSMMQVEYVDSKKLQEYAIKQAERYWEQKQVDTLAIPDHVLVSGNVYTLLHTDTTDYSIDYDKKTIHLNREPTEINQRTLMAASLELVCFHSDISIAKIKRQELQVALFDLLKINNTFQSS